MEQASYLKSTIALKIVYGLTLGFVAAVFSWIVFYYYFGGFTADFLPFLLDNLSIFLFLSAVPLAVFAAVFLTKGGGLDYFGSWNAKKKLQFSGLAVFAGYVCIMLPIVPLDFFSGFRGSSSWGFSLFGLSLITVGFVSLVVLYAKHVSSKEGGTAVLRRKAKKFVLAFTVAVLVVSVVCSVAAYCTLQARYDYLSESYQFITGPHPRLVNTEWSDNSGGDPSFIRYTGGVINVGYTQAFNVTVTVGVLGNDNTFLETQEFFVGDLHCGQYQPLDFTLDYSGKLVDVSSTLSWD